MAPIKEPNNYPRSKEDYNMIRFNSEHDFEMFIYKDFKETGVCLIDDSEYESCIRQFETSGYGIPDLVFINNYGDNRPHDIPRYQIHVVELKNEQIKVKDIAQISRYKTCFDSMFGFDAEISYTLIVPEGVNANDDACWLINSLDEISVLEFALSPKNGIIFEPVGKWTRKNFDKELSKKRFLERISLDKDF